MKIEKFKELMRRRFAPIHMMAGDTLELSYTPSRWDTQEYIQQLKREFGDPQSDGSYKILRYEAERLITVDEALMFSGEFETRGALGVLLLEKEWGTKEVN